MKKRPKAETPPIGQISNSPQKVDKHVPTPSILSSINKTKDFKNSYQKFYN